MKSLFVLGQKVPLDAKLRRFCGDDDDINPADARLTIMGEQGAYNGRNKSSGGGHDA